MKNADNLTVEEMSILLQTAKVRSGFDNQLEARAYEMLMAGTKIPDYKVVRGKPGNRKFEHEDETAVWVFDNKLVKNKGDMYNNKLKSPPQMEKAIKAHGKKSDGLEHYWIKPEGQLTIAHISDKREAVNVDNVTDDFNDQTKE